MKLIDGKTLAEQITQRLYFDVRKNKKHVGLAIILVGNDEGSETYVRLKKESAERIGIDFHLYRFPESSKQSTIEETIDFLNADKDVDGIIIQLPLPKELDENALVSRIREDKDADGFQQQSVARYVSGNVATRAPGLIDGIFELLQSTGETYRGKRGVVVANSHVFADPAVELLKRMGMNAQSVIFTEHPDISACANADVLIVAIGKLNFIGKDSIKNGATIIDVGFNRENGKVYGDVDAQGIADYDGFITPVPGGVGPMTVAMLLQRVVDLSDQHHHE